jgi:hypothetical protein
MPTKDYMHTNFLGDILAFGLNVFHDHLDVPKGKPLERVFAGENTFQFLVEKPMLFALTIFTILPIDISETTTSLTCMRSE